MNVRSAIAGGLLCICWISGAAWGEAEPIAQADLPPDAAPADPYGRDTPRGSMEGFLESAGEGDFERAARYLDLRNLPNALNRYSPETLARGLNLVLERGTWLDLTRLSNSPEGDLGDGLPTYRDPLDTLSTSRGDVELWLQHVPSDVHEGMLIWKVSNRSVARLPELYDEFRFSPPLEYLRTTLPDVRLLGVQLFKWVWSLAVGLAVWVILFGTSRLTTRGAIRRGTRWGAPLRYFLSVPVSISASLLLAGAVLRSLGLGLEAQRISEMQTGNLILIAWVFFTGINFARDLYIGKLQSQGREGTGALIRPLAAALKSVLGIIFVITWLDNAGYNIGALLAGLGIGGVAVALVLQKPLEDVFAAFTLFTQQPIRIGDFGRFGELTGTIEEISLRTTRIRTLENTVVAVPNAKFAAEPIENISARRRILYRPYVRLEFGTTQEQVENILQGVGKLLAGHPNVLEEGRRVRLLRFGEIGIEIEGFAYIDTTVYVDYLEIAEELNLAIMNIVESAGARFAQLSGDSVKQMVATG
jgi:MscS family membrane protein